MLFTALLALGCWDRREIEEESLVLAAGYDRCPEESRDCAFITSRQIAIPGRIPLGPGEGQGPDQQTVEIVSVPAASGPESRAKAQAQLHRQLEFGHTRVLIFAEDYARAGVSDIIDYWRRLSGAHRLIWVTVSEGPAEAVIRARPALERLPAIFLSDMFEDAVDRGMLPNITIGEFMARSSNRGEDPVAPLIRMAAPDVPELAGLAVFRGTTMVGKLSREEMVTYLQLRGIRDGAEQLEVQLPDGHTADLSVIGRKAEYQVTAERGTIHLKVEIELESDLRQTSPEVDTASPETLALIERRAADRVRQQAVALVRKFQHTYRADVLGVGERVRARLPDVWQRVEEDWEAAYADVEFEVTAKVSLRRTGMALD